VMALLYVVHVPASAAAVPNAGGDFSEVRGLLRATTAEGPRQLGDISVMAEGAAVSNASSAWDAASGCANKTAAEASAMDECTCKWVCKSLHSWTSTSKMPTGYVQSDNTAWNNYLDKAQRTDSGSWLDTACTAVCNQDNWPPGTTMMIRRQGVEEEQANGGTSQAYQTVTPKPETTDADGNTIELPATAYTVAKNKVHTFYKELKGSDGKGLKFQVVVQALKVLECVTTNEHYEYCCKNSNPGESSNVNRNKAKKFTENTALSLDHKGNNCDNESDDCWPSARPPVACSVEKTVVPFKICLTATSSTTNSANPTWSDLTTPRCWYPAANPDSKPKPLSPTGSPDWTGIGLIYQSVPPLYSPFGCIEGSECDTSPYGLGTTWVEEFLLTY